MSQMSEPIQSRINENGRVVIPFRIRRAMGLEAGDTVVMTLNDGVLCIEPQRVRIRRIQDELKKYAKPGVRTSDQLVEEREETRIEMEEWLG